MIKACKELNKFQNIIFYYQTLEILEIAIILDYFKTSYVTIKLFRESLKFALCAYFKTSYVTIKPTILSHSSVHQFPQNRSTMGFSSKFTSRHSIFVTVPENAKFPCKIRLSCMSTKFSVGKFLLFYRKFRMHQHCN